MTEASIPNWISIHTIVFDFDGVFTDNKVWIDQNGTESVRCDRGDGLAFDLLRRFSQQNDWNLNYFILSKEKNSVVSVRAAKLRISCVQDNSDKARYIKSYLLENNLSPAGLIYVGNDLNDLVLWRLLAFRLRPLTRIH